MKKLLVLLCALCFALPTFASGTLEVSVSSYKGVVPKNGVRIPFLTIHAKAKNDDVQISEIQVQRNGLSEDNDIHRLIAVTENYRRSSKAGMSDGTATLRFRHPITIDEGSTKRFTVYGNWQITATGGRTIGLSLEGIESDAHSVVPFEKRQIQTPPTIRKKRSYKIVCKHRKCVRVRR